MRICTWCEPSETDAGCGSGCTARPGGPLRRPAGEAGLVMPSRSLARRFECWGEWAREAGLFLTRVLALGRAMAPDARIARELLSVDDHDFYTRFAFQWVVGALSEIGLHLIVTFYPLCRHVPFDVSILPWSCRLMG